VIIGEKTGRELEQSIQRGVESIHWRWKEMFLRGQTWADHGQCEHEGRPLSLTTETTNTKQPHILRFYTRIIATEDSNSQSVSINICSLLYTTAIYEYSCTMQCQQQMQQQWHGGAGLVGKTSGQFYPVLPWVIG